MRFQHIEFLWVLVLIPLFIVVFFYYRNWRKKQLAKIGGTRILDALLPEVSFGKGVLKFILYNLAFACLVIGLANPQIGSKTEEVKREGIDIVVALDLSNSMKSEDLSPNRLERARRAIFQLIEELKSDRLGLVVFGGEAYTQMPITSDISAAKLFLTTIDTDIIPTQGTAIGAAIRESLRAFDKKSPTEKAIIVITDGENHEDDALEAAKEAVELGAHIHTIGVGSPSGAPIPVYRGGRNVGYRKDKSGQPVVSKLNESMLQEIAAVGEGIYFRATNARSGIDYIMEEVNKMEKAEFGMVRFSDYEDQFQWFLGAAILLLILDFLIDEKRNKYLNSRNLFGNS